METIPGELMSAAKSARDRLGGAAGATAARGLGAGAFGGSGRDLAAAARAAIFADALLGAMRSRFEELRTAAKAGS